MTRVTIRRLTVEETLDEFFELTQYAFRSSPPYGDKEDWSVAIRQRKDATYFGTLEDDQVVATVAGSPMTQQVRGAMYDVCGVWGVVTAPAARRKGYSRRLMASLLTAAREAGEPLSCLYPFRASFYERLGYVKFPLSSKVTFAPSALAPLLGQDLGGDVERVLLGDGYDTYRTYLKRLQQRTHGMGVFVHGEKWRAKKENRSWLAVARVGSQVVGVMTYRLEGDEVTRFALRADRFYYDTRQARYLLLQWLARHVDQAFEVELWIPPGERPEMWLADIQPAVTAPPREAMGRVVDLAGLGDMETGPGTFTARVSDPLCPWNERLWRFETVDSQLTVARAEEADCDLTIQAIAALVYGTLDPGDFVYRGWGDPSPDLQKTMRTMFPPRLPYLHERF